jgi:AcrR family transcriptional regulator/DNA-binding MarR family transcriptional regulator
VSDGAHVAAMQRRRILLAVCEVAGEIGLEGATVGRICKRASVSRRSFYEQFEDREACFFAAVERGVGGIGESVLAAYRGEPRWREGIRAALTALLECLDGDPALARVLVVETLRGSPAVLAYRKRVLDELRAAVDEGRRDGGSGAQPVPLTAEITVGGVLAVLHARLLDRDPPLLSELVSALTGMIVQPYLGLAVAQRERERPPPEARGSSAAHTATSVPRTSDPFKDLPIRFTYRTSRVLGFIASNPGASNREIADASGIHDQGQASKLLRRLERHELIFNEDDIRLDGKPNAWRLTPRGQAVHGAIDTQQVVA